MIDALNGAAVHVFSGPEGLWIQLRHSVPTLETISQPSFKVAVQLDAEAALDVASELLRVGTAMLKRRGECLEGGQVVMGAGEGCRGERVEAEAGRPQAK